MLEVVSGYTGSPFNFLALFIINNGVDPRHAGAGTSRLHALKSGHGAAKKASCFGLPPGVDNSRFALPDHLVVPPPHLGFDGFSHRGHVLEVVVVLGGLIRTRFSEHPYGGGSGVEDIDIQLLSDSPGSAGIGIGGNSFVQNTGGGQGKWPIDDIGMARDPADVGHAPIDIFGMDVLNIFGGPGHIGQIASNAVLAPLGLTRCSARVHHKERILRRQGNRVDSNSLIVLQHLVREVVTPFNHRGLGGVFSRVASENQNLIDTLALLLGHLHGDIGVLLVIQQLTRAVVAIDGDQDTASGVGDPLTAGFPTESPIDFRMDDAQSGTGQHGNGKLGGHRHMQCDSIPRLQPGKVSEKCRQLIDPHIEFLKSEGQ